jgi:hypothetical protein
MKGNFIAKRSQNTTSNQPHSASAERKREKRKKGKKRTKVRVRFHGMLELEGIEGRTKKQ